MLDISSFLFFPSARTCSLFLKTIISSVEIDALFAVNLNSYFELFYLSNFKNLCTLFFFVFEVQHTYVFFKYYFQHTFLCWNNLFLRFWSTKWSHICMYEVFIWWSSSIGLSPAIRDMEVMHLEKREDHLGRVIRMPPHCGASIGPLYFNQTPAKVDSHQTSSYLALLAGPGSLCIGVKLFLKSLSFFVCTCRFNSIFMPISFLFLQLRLNQFPKWQARLIQNMLSPLFYFSYNVGKIEVLNLL